MARQLDPALWLVSLLLACGLAACDDGGSGDAGPPTAGEGEGEGEGAVGEGEGQEGEGEGAVGEGEGEGEGAVGEGEGEDPPVNALFEPQRAGSFFDFPFPSDALRDPTTGTLRLAGYPVGGSLGAQLFASYVRRAGEVAYGFGLQQPLYLRFSGPLAAAPLAALNARGAWQPPGAGDPLFLVALDGPERGAFVPLTVRFVADPLGDPFLADDLLIATPRLDHPLASATRYAIVVTDRLTDLAGRPVRPSPTFAAAFAGQDGALFGGPTPTELRALLAELAPGLPPARLVALTTFTTQDVAGQAALLRAALDAALAADPGRWFALRGWREVRSLSYAPATLPAADGGQGPGRAIARQTLRFADGSSEWHAFDAVAGLQAYDVDCTPAGGYPYRVFEAYLPTMNFRGLAGMPYATPGMAGLLADLQRQDGAIRFDLDDDGRLRLLSAPELEPRRIVLQLPAAADGTLLPARGVLLWNHGTGGSAYNAIQRPNPLQDGVRFAGTVAAHGLAILSHDQPLFGTRYDLVSAGYDDYLAAYSPANVPAFRDEQRQGGIDSYLLRRWAGARLAAELVERGLLPAGSTSLPDTRRFVAFGHSLGSVTTHYSLLLHRGDPPAESYEQVLVSGAGGNFSTFFTDSGMVNTLSDEARARLRDLLQLLGSPLPAGETLTPVGLLGALAGVPAAARPSIDRSHPALALLQLLVDPGDPLTYARLLERPERFLMGLQDWQVPNVASLALAGAQPEATVGRCQPQGDYDPHYCTFAEPQGAALLDRFLAAWEAPAAPLPARPALWSEYLAPAQVQAALPQLASLGLDLNLAAARDRWSLAELATVIRAADAAGVRVRLWPLLPLEQGYWACEQNVGPFGDWLRTLADFLEQQRLPVDTFELDLEMDRRRAERLMAAAAAGELGELLGILEEGYDPAGFAVARDAWRDLVAELHQRGYRVELSTLAQVLDDFADGDDTLQDLLDIPITGVDWDRASFQVYRTVFANDFAGLLPPGAAVTADLVASYARSARRHFGPRAALDLGLIQSQGSGFPGDVEAGPLRADVAAALGAGIRPTHLQLFALDGLVERDDWAAWAGGLAVTPPATPPPAASTEQLRAVFRGLDGLH